MSKIPIEFEVTPPLDQEDARVLKALHRGDATPEQQHAALRLIVNKLCRTHDLQYIPGDTHAAAFLSGRAFPGAQILKALNLPIGKLPERPSNG